MIEDKIKSGISWELDFQKRFIGFLKKSPVMFSVQIQIKDGQKGALLKHSNTGLTYFFPFNYNKSTKDFIADIKAMCVQRHYPRLIQEVTINQELTPEEMAIELEKGVKPEDIHKFQLKKLGQRIYIIDKVLLWKSIFILKLEQSTFEDDIIGEYWRYKYNGSGMLFLKGYRQNKFGSIESASTHFFTNSLLISSITPKEANEEKAGS